MSNLKLIKNHQRGLLFALESNRLVSVEKGVWGQAQQLAIPEEGLVVWLKQFGLVKLFRTRLKDQLRHYVVYLPNDEPLSSFGVTEFSKLHDQHWMIEQYHRAIKQVCHIEHFQVRGKVTIKNHLFAAQVAMSNCRNYVLWRSLATAIVYRKSCLTRSSLLSLLALCQNPQIQSTVNA